MPLCRRRVRRAARSWASSWRRLRTGRRSGVGWRRLSESGFGLWCEPPYPEVSGEPDTATLLAAFGYDTGDLDAAVAAFKRHFVPEDSADEIAAEHLALLSCLVARKTGDR